MYFAVEQVVPIRQPIVYNTTPDHADKLHNYSVVENGEF